MEYWSSGSLVTSILVYWYIGILEWYIGILETWEIGNLEPWKPGWLKGWGTWEPGILESANSSYGRWVTLIGRPNYWGPPHDCPPPKSANSSYGRWVTLIREINYWGPPHDRGCRKGVRGPAGACNRLKSPNPP